MSNIDSPHPKGQNEIKLLNSLKSGDTETAEELLELPDIDINCKDEDGNTPILLAVKLNYLDIVKILIEKGVNIDCRNKKRQGVIILACKHKNTDILHAIMKYENQLNLKNPKRNRELEEEKFLNACIKEDLNLVKEMLNESYIDINCKDPKDGYTALHIFSEKGYKKMVKELLKCPTINVNARAFKNSKESKLFSVYNIDYTPLHLAVQNKHIGITELLLKNGADVNARISLESDKYFDYSPLIFACEDQDADEEIVKLLINNHADVDCQISQRARNIKGYTPLHLAVENENFNIMQLLIEKGANVNAKTAGYKQTPLMFASIIGNYDIVVALIKSGADKNITDELGNTALGWAKNYKNESFNMPNEESFLKIIKFLSDG